MHSRALVYVLIFAAWIAFGVIVATIQAHAQAEPGVPRASEPADPPEPGQQLEAAA